MPRISKGFLFAASGPDGLGGDNIDFPEPTIPIEHCDQALGLFMRAWSQLEFAIAKAIEALLGTDELRSHVIMQNVQQAAVRDVLRDAGSFYLNAADQATLNGLLDQIKSLAGVRNKLVHGNWGIHLQQDGQTKAVTAAEWSRDAFVTDGNTLAEMFDPKSQKGKALRAKHHFPPAQIIVEAGKVTPIAEALRNLIANATVHRDHPKLPRAQRRQAARTPKTKSAR